MNKIFKVVWSKVKHCYVVVSEIAKNTISGGSRRSRVRKGALAAALVTTVLGSSFAMPNSVWAANGNMGNSYEALVVLSATKNDDTGEVAFGVDLYRGDNSKKNGVTYLTESELKTAVALGLVAYDNYYYTKVTSVGASTEFSTALEQTVINQIISSVKNGENVSVSKFTDEDGIVGYAINAIDTKNASVSLSINKDNELVVSVIDANKNGEYTKSGSISLNDLKAKIDTNTVLKTNDSNKSSDSNYESYKGLDIVNNNLVLTVKDTDGNVVSGSAEIGTYVSEKITNEAADAIYNNTTIKQQITQNITDINTNETNITNLTNTVNAGWIAKIDDTEIEITPATTEKPNANVLNFAATGAATVSLSGNTLTIGAVDTNTTYEVQPVEAANLSGNQVNMWNVNKIENQNSTPVATITDTDTFITSITATYDTSNNTNPDGTNSQTKIITTYNKNYGDSLPGFSFIAGNGIDLSVDNNAITISATGTGTGSGSSDLGFTSDDKININVDNENNLVEITANVSGEGYLPAPSGQMFKANAKDGTTGVEYKGQLKKLRIGNEEFDVSVITAIESVEDGTPLLRAVQLGDQEYRIVSQDYKLVGAAVKTDSGTSYTGEYNVAGNTVRLNVYDEENGVLGSPVIINGIASVADLNNLNFGVIKTTTTDNTTVTTNKLGLVGSDGTDLGRGSVEVTTAVGSGGKDATITFGGTDGFTLPVGSTVRANVDDLASGAEPLTNLRVNGQDYKLFTGSDVATNNNLRVEQGYENKEPNSNDTTLHGWVLVDDSQKVGNNPKTYSDTTLKAGSATFNPSVTNGESDDKEVVYGGNYTISDTAGNKVTLEDVASANALKDVADRVTVVENSIVNINQNIANAKTEVVAGNANVTVVETNSGDTNGNGEIDDNETQGHTIYTVSSKDTITTIEAGDNVVVSGGLNNDGNYAYTISATDTDTNTTNVNMEGTGWVAGSDGKATDDLLIKVNDSDGKSVEATIKDVAKASDLKQEVKDRQEADSVLAGAIISNQQNVQNLNAGLNKLGNRMNKVGAGSAALAALHPMDFDPDDKLQFSAGVGHYGGENAAALGAFYRPTEKVMFSVAGTMGNGEDMVNAGVTFALDKPNNVSNSRVAMAREIQDLRQQVAALTMLVMQMASRDNAALAGVAMFPDVPENHWAYDYIEGLQKQGIIEGYPDGNFGGDRSMTRYEFAAMLYRALEKGFPVDSRLLNEFNAELGRIRVDRIKGSDNDANKVERVRVNADVDRDDYGSKIVQVKAGA